MMNGQTISDNEIYLLIKCVKSVFWRVAELLSYMEDARCLKVKRLYALLFELAVFVHFLTSKFGTTVNVIVFCDNLIQRTITCI